MKYVYMTMLSLGLLIVAGFNVYAGQTCVCQKIGNMTYCNCY